MKRAADRTDERLRKAASRQRKQVAHRYQKALHRTGTAKSSQAEVGRKLDKVRSGLESNSAAKADDVRPASKKTRKHAAIDSVLQGYLDATTEFEQAKEKLIARRGGEDMLTDADRTMLENLRDISNAVFEKHYDV